MKFYRQNKKIYELSYTTKYITKVKMASHTIVSAHRIVRLGGAPRRVDAPVHHRPSAPELVTLGIGLRDVVPPLAPPDGLGRRVHRGLERDLRPLPTRG